MAHRAALQEVEATMTDVLVMLGELESLKSAMRSGALSVSYEGKSVTYRSLAELQSAIAGLERELGLDLRPRRVVVRTDKGW